MRVNRDALIRFIEEAGASLAARRAPILAAGAAARAEGLPASFGASCVLATGSWVWKVWLEGWSGTAPPCRESIDGVMNMTPREEMQAYHEWMVDLGLPEDQIASAIAIFRLGYKPEVLGREN